MVDSQQRQQLESQLEKLIQETDEGDGDDGDGDGDGDDAGQSLSASQQPSGPVTSYDTLFFVPTAANKTVNTSKDDNEEQEHTTRNLFATAPSSASASSSKPQFSFVALSEERTNSTAVGDRKDDENDKVVHEKENKNDEEAVPMKPRGFRSLLSTGESKDGQRPPIQAGATMKHEYVVPSKPPTTAAAAAAAHTPMGPVKVVTEDPTIDESSSPQHAVPSPFSRQTIVIRRELDEEGIFEEEEIVFEKDLTDEEDTREKVVQFTGLPEHPPELTMESMSRSSLDDIEDDDDDGDGDDDGDDDDNVGEEEETDDSSSVETPPIPVQVSHEVVEEHSEYDEELEFDASETTSEDESSSEDADDEDYDEVEESEEQDDTDVGGEDEVIANKVAVAALHGSIEDRGPIANSAIEPPPEEFARPPETNEDLQSDIDSAGENDPAIDVQESIENDDGPVDQDPLLGTVFAMLTLDDDNDDIIDLENEGGHPIFETLDSARPEQDHKALPEQKPEPQLNGNLVGEGGKAQEKNWLILVGFLLCCTLAGVIAIPVVLSQVANDRLPSRTIPMTPPPTYAPSFSPAPTITHSPTSLPSLRPTRPPSQTQTPNATPVPPPTDGSPPTTNAPQAPGPTPNLTDLPTNQPTARPTTSTPTLPPEPPENDTCSSALGPLIPDGSPTIGTITLAGVDDVDRCGEVSTSGPGVWYYVLGTGGEMMAHTCLNTNFDSKVTIFKGDCDKPLCLEANDDFCGSTGAFSAVSWQSEYRQEYRILVHGEPVFMGSGTFELAVIARYNDECSTAIGPLAIHQENMGPPVMGNTLAANPNVISCNGEVNTSPSVFYLARGTGGIMTASVCEDSDFGARISVLMGSCPEDSLECIGRTDFFQCSVSWNSIAFQEYYLVIHGTTEEDIGNFELVVSTSEIPNNDGCSRALGPLLLDGTVVEGTTAGAQVDASAPFCLSAVTSPGVWYFVIGNGSSLQASLCDGATFDTRLSVYQGDCSTGDLTSLLCIDGNDDFCGTDSLVTWFAEEGTGYFLLVHGYQNGVGDFKLSVTSF